MPEPDPLPAIKTPWDSGTPPSGVSPGDVPPIPIPDHTLIRRVGKGSYGEVWLARNALGVYRAVKIIHRGSFDDDRPFEREFAGMQRFEPVSRSHESQLNILQVGRGPDCFYYVMELADDMRDAIPGNAGFPTGESASSSAPTGKTALQPDTYTPRNLRSELLLRGRLPVDECIRLGLALTTALEHLHRHGLVHRDIKPSNIVFVNGIPKLADIGLVALAESTMSFVGTEGYLPPEGPGTVQADVFSLGKVLYEISTGRDRQQFPELPTGITELPDRAALAELNEVLLRACAPDVKQRYESAAEMHADLALLQSGKSVARMRAVERRLKFVARAGAIVTAVALLAFVAFWFQARQTQKARDLASQNLRLAEASRDQLVRLQVENGNRYVDESNYSDALLWFAEAWKLVQRKPDREEVHGMRLDSVLRNSPRIVQMYKHDAEVLWCEFSSDGKRIASASKDRTARVWDVVSGKPVSPPLHHAGVVERIIFSPDDRRVLTICDDKTVRIWDASGGDPLSPALEHEDEVGSAEFSPDGTKVLSVSKGGPARIWNVAQGAVLAMELTRPRGVKSASFSPDGQRVLTRDAGNTATIWDANLGQPLLPPIDTWSEINVAVFSPDGERILTGSGFNNVNPPDVGTAQVWSARTGIPITPPMLHKSPVLTGSFCPDGSRVITGAAGYRNGVRTWNAQTGEQIGSDMPGPGLSELCIFSPEGTRVAAGGFRQIQVWDADTGMSVTPPMCHADAVLAASFSPDGYYLATASVDHLVRIWSLITEEGPDLLLQHADPVRDARFSPDGQSVLTCSGAKGLIWNAATGDQLVPALMHTSMASLAAFSPDGSNVVMALGTTKQFAGQPGASVWKAATGEKLFELHPQERVAHAVFSDDSKHLLTATYDGLARVWDAMTGEPAAPPLHHQKAIISCGFSPDGKRVVTASWDHTAQVWDWATGHKPFAAFRYEAEVLAAAYTPDGRRIASISFNGTVRIWDAATGNLLTVPSASLGYRQIQRLAMRPDSRAVMGCGDAGDVHVWNIETGDRSIPALTHKEQVNWADFSSDSRFIVTASQDQTARVWDAFTGEPISVPLRHTGAVLKAAFHTNGSRILTAAEDGAARIWILRRPTWPLEDVSLLVDLLSASEIDPTLTQSRLSSDRIYSAFQILRARYPGEITVRSSKPITWHRRQAAQAEAASQWSAANWHLSSLIAGRAEEAELYERRAASRAELGQWELARQDYSKALAMGGSNFYHLLLVSLKMGDKSSIQSLAERVAAQKPDRVHYGLMIAPDLLADYSALTLVAEESVAKAPQTWEAWGDYISLGMLHFRAGRYEEAARTLESVHVITAFENDLDNPTGMLPNPGPLYRWTLVLAGAGHLDKARSVLERGRQREQQLYRRPTSMGWENKVEYELQRIEAEALIEKRTSELHITPSPAR